MSRKILQPNDYAVISPPGTYLKHIKIPGEKIGTNFPAEIVARSRGDYIAHKVLPIFVTETQVKRMRSHIEAGKFCEPARFFFTVRDLGFEECRTLIMYVNRPVYYLPFPNDGKEGEIAENWQLEIPGGKAKATEEGAQAGIREMVEEAGIGVESVLCYTHAYPGYIANDSGTHAEIQKLWFALVIGDPRPPVGKEGIVGYATPTLREVRAIIREHYGKKGVVPEVWVPYAVDSLLLGVTHREEGVSDTM